MTAYGYITIVSAIILIILILVQTRGAGLGAGLGGSGEVNTVRRGSDRTVHQITIITALIFVLSLMAGVLG